MRSEGQRHLKETRYPKGVIADRKKNCNNAFSVEKAGDLNPG